MGDWVPGVVTSPNSFLLRHELHEVANEAWNDKAQKDRTYIRSQQVIDKAHAVIDDLRERVAVLERERDAMIRRWPVEIEGDGASRAVYMLWSDEEDEAMWFYCPSASSGSQEGPFATRAEAVRAAAGLTPEAP